MSSKKIHKYSQIFPYRRTTIANPVFANFVHPAKTSHLAFTPPRADNKTWYYVDGEQYFADLYKHITALSTRKKEKPSFIYISGWGMEIDTYLVRKGKLEIKHRLINVLRDAALRNIQIRIILFDPYLPGKLGLRDVRQEAVLESILGNVESTASNIQVIRHRPWQEYSMHQKSVVIGDPDENTIVAFLGGLDIFSGRWDTSQHKLTDANETLFPDGDYSNPTIGELDRNMHPRLPWHDVHMGVEGAAALDVERNFVDRWQRNVDTINRNWDSAANNWEYLRDYVSDVDDEKYKYRQVRKSETHLALSGITPTNKGRQLVQVLRSVCHGIAGVTRTVEKGIYETYIKAIKSAQHYVYLESQYLIGSYNRKSINKVLEALVERIVLAYARNENFRVYLVFPITPDGIFAEDDDTKENMFWQWCSVHRERDRWDAMMQNAWGGMIHALEEKMGKMGSVSLNKETGGMKFEIGPGYPTIMKYLRIFNLRTHGMLGDRLVTEQIYVHSKMMIVDDRVAIIGSANINDRSMNGNRDEELNAIVVDQDTDIKTIDGKEVYVRQFARELRLKLWKKHLGLAVDDKRVDDPVVEETHNFITATSARNTEAFEYVFPGIPSNRFGKYAQQLAAVGLKPDAPLIVHAAAMRMGIEATATTQQKLTEIKGHLVDFPLLWLWFDTIIQDYDSPNYLFSRKAKPPGNIETLT